MRALHTCSAPLPGRCIVLAESWSVCPGRPPWSTLTGLYSDISQSIEMEGSVDSNTAKQADKRLGKAIPNGQIVKDVRPLGEERGTLRNFSILQRAFCLPDLQVVENIGRRVGI